MASLPPDWQNLSPSEQKKRIDQAARNLNELTPKPNRRDAVRLVYAPLLSAIAQAHARGIAWKAIAASLVADGLPPVRGETLAYWCKQAQAEPPALTNGKGPAPVLVEV